MMTASFRTLLPEKKKHIYIFITSLFLEKKNRIVDIQWTYLIVYIVRYTAIYINSCDFYKRYKPFHERNTKAFFYFPQEALMINKKTETMVKNISNAKYCFTIDIVYLILDTDNLFSSVNSMQALHSSAR